MKARLRSLLLLTALSLVALLVFGVAFNTIRNRGERSITDYEASSDPNLTKAVYTVGGLSCSSCIETIQSALGKIRGVEKVLVDLSRGKTQVYYNAGKIGDPELLAREITQSGYPAAVEKVVSPDELVWERQVAQRKSEAYVVGVGAWDVPREDFEIELEAAMHQYRTLYGQQVLEGREGRALVEDLKVQCLNRLISEAVMLQEVSRAGYDSRKDMDYELQAYLERNDLDLDGLRNQLNEFGYSLSYFRKKFENQVVIQEFLDEKVLVSASSSIETPRLYDEWYRNAQTLTEVVYYDSELEELVELSAAGASGDCCAP